MFDSLCRLCTGETLEISQEMSIHENGTSNVDNTMIDHEAPSVLMLQPHEVDDEELATTTTTSNSKSKKKSESKIKAIKQKQSTTVNYAR